MEEEAGLKDESYWGLRLRGEDNTSSSEEATRGSGVHTFGSRRVGGSPGLYLKVMSKATIIHLTKLQTALSERK
jgi:hypothetical protein